MRTTLVALVALVTQGAAFTPTTRSAAARRSAVSMEAAPSRRDFVSKTAISVAAGVSAFGLGPGAASAASEGTTKGGVQYRIIKEGKGETAKLGDLAGVRFKCAYKGVVFDDILDAPEPYFMRVTPVGEGALIKGIYEVLPDMKVGEQRQLLVPGSMAFGEKGRPPSPGKPRIPPNADIDYILELSALPGKEQELLDMLDDE